MALGKPSHEPVDSSRDQLNEWLIATLTGQEATTVPYDRTIYLTSDELVDEPESLEKWLRHSRVDSANSGSSLVLDLADNSYDLLREPVLYAVSTFAVKWISGGSGRTAAIILPNLPAPNASIFWLPLKAGDSSRISVLALDGEAWREGRRDSADARIASTYSEKRSESLLDRDSRTTVEGRIVKELGHFPVAGSSGEFCARYFFDGSLAINEIARLLTNKLKELGFDEQPIVLLTHGAHSDWLHEAGLLAGAKLASKAPAYNVTEIERVADLVRPGQLAVPIFDVVNSGSTCSLIVRRLQESGVPLAATVLTVMMDRRCGLVELPSGVSLEDLLEVSSKKVEREKCVQCQLGLPFTPPLTADYKCRPYDMWQIFLSVDWPPEDFGPAGVRPYAEAPHMGQAFTEFGDWLAYKVFVLLRREQLHGEIVFVCPAEVHIDKLMACLSRRLLNRVAVVRIPRECIQDLQKCSTTGEEVGWKSQLKHVAAASRRAIIMIDEFNGSGTTARAMLDILKMYDIAPDLYVPILDRKPEMGHSFSVDVRSLYEIPSPRIQ
ncbi:hypothetical protein AB0368_15870 [Actinoplanes sp. NPDC051475]|uniref:hypothetical protein n=1 Tax=Actinoplanes sp. NPDC051475 TaxID=3157225 RepID=UPI00344B0228